MEPLWDSCCCTAHNLVSFSSPNRESDHPNELKPRIHRFVISDVPFMIPLMYSYLDNKPKRSATGKHVDFESNDDLEPGDLVQVRSEDEVRSTLNRKNTFKGLRVMPEMTKHFGHEYRVFKKLNKIMIESTGELRTIKSPTYMLEGVYCDGEFHKGCDRSCFLLWKREWLRKL